LGGLIERLPAFDVSLPVWRMASDESREAMPGVACTTIRTGGPNDDSICTEFKIGSRIGKSVGSEKPEESPNVTDVQETFPEVSARVVKNKDLTTKTRSHS